MLLLVSGLCLAGLASLALIHGMCDIAALSPAGRRASLSRLARRHPLETRLRSCLSFIGRLRGISGVDRVEIRLRAAGQPLELTPAEFLGTQVAGCASLSLLAMAATAGAPYAVAAGAAVGWFYPEVWLIEKTRSRQASIASALPFAIDLLSICAEAGLGFDASLGRILEVLPSGPLTDELVVVVREIRMGQSRKDALRGLAQRVPLQEVGSLVSSLIQADQLGAGISSALPVLAEQARMKRYLAAEAMAAKAPVKMLFPLAGLIFPCILLLLLGPMLLSGALRL